jgi:hypothetical protein
MVGMRCKTLMSKHHAYRRKVDCGCRPRRCTRACVQVYICVYVCVKIKKYVPNGHVDLVRSHRVMQWK